MRGTVYIRPATHADMPALSRICLLTGDAGRSAKDLHTYGELIGDVYALPYVGLSEGATREAKTWGFVVVSLSDTGDRGASEESKEQGQEKGEVVGYVLGTSDTRTFERVTEREWYPPLQERFPLSLLDFDSARSEPHQALKDADKRYIRLLHAPDRASDQSISFSPAHLHIDILPSHQRQGWGRRLISAAAERLKADGIDGVWVGLDPRNESAVFFYAKLGFKPLEDVPGKAMGLQFGDLK